MLLWVLPEGYVLHSTSFPGSSVPEPSPMDFSTDLRAGSGGCRLKECSAEHTAPPKSIELGAESMLPLRPADEMAAYQSWPTYSSLQSLQPPDMAPSSAHRCKRAAKLGSASGCANFANLDGSGMVLARTSERCGSHAGSHTGLRCVTKVPSGWAVVAALSTEAAAWPSSDAHILAL